MKVVISSGHGKYVRGASGVIDEVDEARKVVEAVAEILGSAGVTTVTFHDDVSTTQSENLNRIVNYHNSQSRDLDVSVHFNAYKSTSAPMGTECLYLTQSVLAANMASAMAEAGQFINRGAKKRTDLAFLNGTEEPSILLETCFVDSSADADLYKNHFDAICTGIAETIAGKDIDQPVEPPTAEVPLYERPTLRQGKRGSSVLIVQSCLRLEMDGEYDPRTEAAVEEYQRTKGLSVDGTVGPNTWAALEDDFELSVYPPVILPDLSRGAMELITETAAQSEVTEYYWDERGYAPIGYIKGMAFAFATMLRKLEYRDPIAIITAQADREYPAQDALSWYHDQFAALGMDNSDGDVDTLRHLFVLLFGLGMRESSGRHCCGRDMSASNTSSETCEAGLFQTSWNASSCSTDFEVLLEAYSSYGPCQQAALDLFKDDVSCSAAEWSNYGNGVGYEYQELAKNAPQFAVETTAMGLRYLRQHWGPINRYEAELRPEVDALLSDIQELILRGEA